jgi:hypothetical protein
MKIKTFEMFSAGRTLLAFDFDDTLVETPRFEDLAIAYLGESMTIGDMLERSAKRIGILLSDMKWQDGRIYVEDPKAAIEVPQNDRHWVRKGSRVYLLQPDEFGLTEMSIPDKATELKKLYDSTEDKCIVTARPESMRRHIEECLENLGFEYPKYGLHMYPSTNHRMAGSWKGRTMANIAKKEGFDKVVFYDDNSKYIKAAKKAVAEEMPELDFTAIKV